MSTGKALDTFRTEAKKCVLVCANCHGEIECGLIASPPAGARYGDPYPIYLDAKDADEPADEQAPLFSNQAE